MNPSTMQDNFENDVQSDSWLFVNDGVVGSYCQQNVRYKSYILAHKTEFSTVITVTDKSSYAPLHSS